MELLSMTIPVPFPSSETQVMVTCRKKTLVFSWFSTFASGLPGSHAGACVGTTGEAAWGGDQTEGGQGTMGNIHQAIFSSFTAHLPTKKNFPFISTSTHCSLEGKCLLLFET